MVAAWHVSSVELTLDRADEVLPVQHPRLLQWPTFQDLPWKVTEEVEHADHVHHGTILLECAQSFVDLQLQGWDDLVAYRSGL